MIESSLIKRCINGERKAYKQCYELCAPYIYAVISSYIFEKESRKDMMQEVFIQIFKSLESYQPSKGNIKFWMRRITINKCISELRKNSSKLNLIPLEDFSDVENYTDEIDFENLTREEILDGLKAMPEGYRTIFMLFVIDEYSHKEIAELLNIKPETSRSQLLRGKKWIKNNFSLASKSFNYG